MLLQFEGGGRASYISASPSAFRSAAGWPTAFGTHGASSSAAVAIFTALVGALRPRSTVPMLVAARIFQGIGAAMMMPVGRLAIIRTFPQP